ncbi:MAG: LysM peptidoglycan-binding domain-containing protein [Gammaproteobacteria bacterium]|nr:LysM peptidoglycan-binding domain-containing protein [Gammaproteobacteria bacterium]
MNLINTRVRFAEPGCISRACTVLLAFAGLSLANPGWASLTSAGADSPNTQWTRSEIANLLRTFGQAPPITVPGVLVERVRGDIERFVDSGDLRPWFERALRRMDKHKTMLDTAFRKYALPRELQYLGLIESSFNSHAKSPSGAVGMWQFMPGTARQYALKVSRRGDQRLDPYLSTQAAARHLADLIKTFGRGESTLLALAAYNAGEARVRKAMSRSPHAATRFNELAAQGLLPRETVEFVPRILAAAIVGENRGRFGFPGGNAPLIYLVRKNNTWQQISTWSGVPVTLLRSDNPRHRRMLLANTPLRVRDVGKSLEHRRYRIKSGDTLSKIAWLHRVETSWLRGWNNLKDSRVYAGRYLDLFVPSHIVGERGRDEYLVYQVVPGNTLGSIANAFAVSVDDLRKVNGLQNSAINAGQSLIVPVVSVEKLTITIPSGSSLASIGHKYGVSPRALQTFNGLTSTLIRSGDPMAIYVTR